MHALCQDEAVGSGVRDRTIGVSEGNASRIQEAVVESRVTAAAFVCLALAAGSCGRAEEADGGQGREGTTVEQGMPTEMMPSDSMDMRGPGGGAGSSDSIPERRPGG